MKRINLPLILDTLFFALCAFVLSFTAVRFYTKSPALALTFAIVWAIFFGVLGYIYISRKQNKKLLLSRDEREKKLLALHLSLSSDDYILKLFKSCLGEGATIRGKKIFTEENVCYFFFKMQAVSEDDIAYVIKHPSEKKKIVYCTKISPEAAYLSQNFGIEFVDADGVYKLLKKHDALPEKYLYEDKRAGAFAKIKARFNRKLTAPLFFSGAALLFISYFTFFPVYYIVSGGIMILLSLITFIFKA